jgi:predicted RNase H-like HicB family nuclease
MELHVIFEPDEEGGAQASPEELPEAITCAPTLDLARELVRDALTEWLSALTGDERTARSAGATRETLTLSIADHGVSSATAEKARARVAPAVSRTRWQGRPPSRHPADVRGSPPQSRTRMETPLRFSRRGRVPVAR